MNRIKLLPSLLIFAEIAAKGSFTAAANALGLSKSAVSQQLSKLERELGLQLLVRNTRGVFLTDIGRRLLLRCELLSDQVELAFTELSNAAQAPSGRFSVTFPHALERTVVNLAITQLCREYPGLEPRLIVSDERKDLVQDKIDAAIYAGNPQDSSYRAQRIGTMKEIFCATPTFVQRFGRVEQCADLHHLHWIATSWQKKPLSIYHEETGDQEQITVLKQTANVNTLPGAVDLAMQHMGIILLPEIIGLPLIHAGELVRVLERYRGPLWPVYFVHGFQHKKPIYVERFRQLTKHYLEKIQL